MDINVPYLNNDAFRKLCDYCFWHDAAPRENPNFRNGDIVFCKIDEVWRLFRALRRTRKRIVLVTAEGSKPVTTELYRQKPPHVSHWFGTNMFAEDYDVTPIPLGVGNAAGGSALRPEEFPPGPLQGDRTFLLYSNFTARTNGAVREPLARWAAGEKWITFRGHTGDWGKGEYLEALRRHHFVLCPPGAGEDTHRMWEALYCGAVPVVRDSPAMRSFKDLPILVVPQFDGLSEQFLRDELTAWPQRHFSREKVGMDYWKARFSAAQQAALIGGPLTLKESCAAWIKEIRLVAGRRVALTVA